MQMLEGLEAAHASGIVHRDLKPDNVFVMPTHGRPARQAARLRHRQAAHVTRRVPSAALTRPGVIMGTPEYMAPEQAYSADSVDARADIFSLGVMLYEMLAGRRPRGGDEPQQIAACVPLEARFPT